MQELKQIKLADAVGKKIAGIEVEAECHVIKYDDGTFTHFARWEEWGLDLQDDYMIKYDHLIKTVGISVDRVIVFTPLQRMLIDLGIIDEKKLVEDAKENLKHIAEELERNERKTYERLRQKYGK